MTDETRPTIIEIYQRHSHAWAALRSDALIERSWLDRFSAIVPAGGSVLDIGCGSGAPIGRELVRRGFDLTGVDGAPGMVALFRRNLPDAAAHVMDMRQLSLSRRFFGLLAWDSLFHLSPDDQRRMFARFEAHAAPRAALMFTSGDEEGSTIGELESDLLYHGSLNPSEYRGLLDRSGFDLLAHVVADPTCSHHTVWLAQRRS